jgi:HNH endonuclease/AP2 domain
MAFAPQYLQQRLRYDPATGKLFWRHYDLHSPQWNGKWAGREALTALSTYGYRHGSIDSRGVAAHSVAYAIHHGVWSVEIDHIDHDRTNNRIKNLREVNRLANRRNASRMANNTSGVNGVSWCSREQLWRAYIAVGQQQISLGYFRSLDDAAAAREAADRKYDFHPNHGAAA